MAPRGKCRETNGWGNQDSVKVVYDDGNEMDLPADEYEENGYQPPIDQLPECGK
jgi:hypothetical protein